MKLRRLLLLPYPRRFRQRHGADLLELYEDTFASGASRSDLRFWVRAGFDAVRQGLAARFSEPRRKARLGRRRRLQEGDARGAHPPGRRPGTSLDRLWLDIRYGLRSLQRAPVFTLVATATLAVAIGANTAIFSLVHAVLIRPLPFDGAERIVRIYGGRIDESGRASSQVSFPNLVDVADQATSFEAVSVVDSNRPVLLSGGSARQLRGRYVMASYFRMLGVDAAVGRVFRPDDEGPGNSRVVLLTHGLWQRQFGGDAAVVGRTINLSGRDHTIVGVLPAYYEQARVEFESLDAELYRPWPYRLEDRPYRSGRSMAAVGKLRDGVSLAAAQDEVDAVFRRLAREYPEANAGRGMTLVPMQEAMVRGVRRPLLLLLGSVVLVLLIACTNVGNLLLARGSVRRRELAVRAALGAGRGRLLTQMGTESLLLAVLGGASGVALAFATRNALLTLAGDALPRVHTIPFHPAVLLASLSLVLVTAALIGIAPALRAMRGDFAERLRATATGATGDRSRRRAARWLVVAEVSLAVTLLAGAALMLRGFVALLADDPGFDSDTVIAAQLVPLGSRYAEPADADALYRGLLAEVTGIPRIDAAGIINILPMGSNYSCDGFRPDDRPEPGPGEGVCAETRAIAGDYFQAMGIPVHSGRAIDEHDTAEARPVVVISESVASRFWPGEDPVGRTLSSVHGNAPREIIGVVGDTLHFGLGTEAPLQLYIPLRQDPWGWSDLFVVARAPDEPAALVSAVRDAVRRVDAEVALPRVAPMGEYVAGTVSGERFRSTLLTIFAVTAVLLAMAGLYGVLSASVEQRLREIGIRVSLGASTRQVVRLIVGEGMSLVGAGLVLGLAGGVAAGSALRGLLYGVAPTDLPILAAVGLLLAAVALLACWLPARRATRVDPVVVMRND